MDTKLTYQRKGDYLYPNLTLESEVTEPIGKYGLMRKSYLKENKRAWYRTMLLTGELDQHLLDIDKAANARLEEIMKQLLESNPAPDKATDQMGWVRHMNSLKASAEEIILAELIYC